MQNFELPTNIRQIGTIAEGLKIYVEDYVCTYLKQYADAGGHCDRVAFLIGKDVEHDGQRYVFISGAIQGRFSESEDGCEVFSERSFAYCDEQCKTYFPDLDVVGWMQSQPEYGTALTSDYAEYHMEHFTKPTDVLFVMDPVDRANAFYTWDEAQKGLLELGGYYIYYDKNAQMQAYMTDNRLVTQRAFDTLAAVRNGHPPQDKGKAAAPKKPVYDDDDEPIRAPYDEPPRKPSDYRRVVNMLVSLSAVLVVICFIMGAGLAQSDNRIAKLEKDLSSLNSTYGYLVSQVSAINTMPVFAEQDPAGNSEASGQNPLDGTASFEPETSPTDSIPSEEPEPSAEPTPTPTPEPTPIPDPTPAPLPSAAPEVEDVFNAYETYTVQQGDSLISISRRFYGDAGKVDEIMALNGLDDPNKIFFGKVLLLP